MNTTTQSDAETPVAGAPPRPRRRGFSAILAFALGAFLFGTGAVGAYAAAVSSNDYFGGTGLSGVCYFRQAATENGYPERGYGIVSVKQNALFGCTATSVSGSVGAAAWLKRPNGTACATATVLFATNSIYTRNAYYNAAACGTGQLQGTMTGYGYDGSAGDGYASSSIAAPFLSFP